MKGMVHLQDGLNVAYFGWTGGILHVRSDIAVTWLLDHHNTTTFGVCDKVQREWRHPDSPKLILFLFFFLKNYDHL